MASELPWAVRHRAWLTRAMREADRLRAEREKPPRVFPCVRCGLPLHDDEPAVLASWIVAVLPPFAHMKCLADRWRPW